MVLDVASGATRPLTARKGFEGYAVFSPDGARVAYWYPRDGDLNNVNEIFVTAAAGGAGASVTRALDRNLLRAIWMPDGKALLVGGHDGTRTAVRKSTRLNSSHLVISYAVFCLKKKKKNIQETQAQN